MEVKIFYYFFFQEERREKSAVEDCSGRKIEKIHEIYISSIYDGGISVQNRDFVKMREYLIS